MTTALTPHLSRARYLAGLQCERRLWLGWHDPEPNLEAMPGSILAVGHEVGQLARGLYAGGVLIGGGPEDFPNAVSQTNAILTNPRVPAIYEAAFAFDGVLVRTDVLRRRAGGSWDLLEVRPSTRLKREHVDDLAVQKYVLEGCGVKVNSASIIHIDASYVRGAEGLDLSRYLARVDVTNEVAAALTAVPARVAKMHATVALSGPPAREPTVHCFSPFACEFWDRCAKNKPSDWIWRLPRLQATRLAELRELGIRAVGALPYDFPLAAAQRQFVQAFRDGGLVVRPGLAGSLPASRAPMVYLDFETFSPAIPLHAGTRPFERIPAQWSLHSTDAYGRLTHQEFLGDLSGDPRRAVAESLLAALGGEGRVAVYSSFESSVLGDLARRFHDLARPLRAVRARLVDLLPVVRRFVDHPAVQGSNSIKAVAPVLAPEVSYDLKDVADGGAASPALYRLATAHFRIGETTPGMRAALQRRCEIDSLALMLVHRGLIDLARPEKGVR